MPHCRQLDGKAKPWVIPRKTPKKNQKPVETDFL
jgi:hypothetical protein